METYIFIGLFGFIATFRCKNDGRKNYNEMEKYENYLMSNVHIYIPRNVPFMFIDNTLKLMPVRSIELSVDLNKHIICRHCNGSQLQFKKVNTRLYIKFFIWCFKCKLNY